MTEAINKVMTKQEAAKYVKSLRGKSMTLFVSCNQLAPIEGDEGKAFPIYGNVEVTRKVAIKFINDAYSDILAERGARIRISILGQCVFIGS